MKKSTGIVVSSISVILMFAGSLLFYALAGPTIVAEYVSRDSNENLDFSFEYCESEIKQKKPLLSRWVGENTLLVTGVATPNCGTSWIFGDFEVSEDNLTLTYSPVMHSLFACFCNYDVEYKITNLERREYNIKLAESGGIYKEPELLYKLLGMYD